MTTALRRVVPGFAVAALTGLAAAGAYAQDASPWIRDSYSSVRLIAGSRSGGAFLGGIAFQLQPGWKTYWRYPGDSGVPPRFDFSRSRNLKHAAVMWPAPMRFDDGLYRVLGEQLLALTDSAEAIPTTDTWNGREPGGIRAPAALVGALRFTL